jgi:hypothetical protein
MIIYFLFYLEIYIKRIIKMRLDSYLLRLNEMIAPRFDVFRLKTLYINGIEVTQAIQCYHSSEHLTDPSDQAVDNSVELVTGKPAWVRVYVRSNEFFGDIPNVSGTLEVSCRELGILYNVIDNLAPQSPGIITARSAMDYATERQTINATLNFIIPAEKMCGNLRLRATVSSPYGDSAESIIYIHATLQQTLKVRGIMVGYSGPNNSGVNIILPAPTLADLQATSAWTLLTYPIESTAIYGSAGSITWNLPLTDAPSCNGCCSPNWVALNAAVQAQRVADGNKTDVLYYGLMAVGIPMGAVIGCNSGGVSTGANGDEVTMAHELGHACGLPHAPCNVPGDPNYPAYEPYDPPNFPKASIGEYGLDISNGAIFPPSVFKDMMAYCGPRWISLYNYGRLTNNANLNPITKCADYPWWRDIILHDPMLIPKKWLPDPPPDPDWRRRELEIEPVISIIGVLHSENEIEIKSIMRTPAIPRATDSFTTDLMAELMEGEKILASATIYRLRSISRSKCDQDGSDPFEKRYPSVFQAFVPDRGQGTSLRIYHGDKELWTRKAPAQRPQISYFDVQVKDEWIEVRWKLESSGEQEAEFWLQWSNDEGKNWHGLTSGLRDSIAKVNVSSVPPGKISIRLLASDGFFTTESKSITIGVADRAPSISILMPREGQTLVHGRSMRLWGAVTNQMDRAERPLEISWLMDGKKEAVGLDAFVTTPPSGEHQLTLDVKYGDLSAKASVAFTSIDLPSKEVYKLKSFWDKYIIAIIMLFILLFAIIYYLLKNYSY